MKLKALKSFIGKKVSMNVDDIKEVLDERVAKDLIRVGYAIEIKESKKNIQLEDKKASKGTKSTSKSNKRK